ncbi:unnamed protein product [Cochlearia groenlandica]
MSLILFMFLLFLLLAAASGFIYLIGSNTKASDNQYFSQSFEAEDEFAMEERENQETNVVKPDSSVNYQTYMNKTSRTRWSKEDTNLFYEGIREFGSNLSMVYNNCFLIKRVNKSNSNSNLKNVEVIKKLLQEVASAKEDDEDEEEDCCLLIDLKNCSRISPLKKPETPDP